MKTFSGPGNYIARSFVLSTCLGWTALQSNAAT